MRLSATRLTSIAQAGGGRTLIQRAISVLRRFGTNAHVYLPGVGMLNGLQAGNYIDSAGTQAGAVDQPVGLVLDAAGGLGVTLANCTFASGVDGWSNSYQSTIAAVGGKLRVTATASNPYASLALTTVVGATYKISLSMSTGTITGNNVSVIADNSGTLGNFAYGALSTANAPGGAVTTPSFIFTATSTVFQIRARAGIAVVGEYFEMGDVLIREVTGIHASQTTTSNKCILRQTGGRYNWVFDATDLLTATFPAGNESVTVIDALGTGQVTTTGVNVVGAYSVGPSVTLYGRLVIKGALSASDLALLQGFANRLAGL